MGNIDRRRFLDTVGKGAAGAIGGAALMSGATDAQKATGLNVITILIDDMGWTDLGCFGSDLYETPNIDRLASRGVRFTNAYAACTVCSPTRAAMMTGKYPATLHITDWIHGHERPHAKLAIPDWTHELPLEEVSVATALGDGGYRTCHVGKWHLGDEGHWPTDHGFDINLGGYHRGQPPRYFSPYDIPTLEDGPEGEYLTDREGIEAAKFIEENADRPFFLYLPHYAVHTPLQAKQSMIEAYEKKVKPDGRHKNATYASMVESVDESTGRIMDTLERLGIDDRTLIVFTSDNGGLKPHATNNSPLRAGKGSSYEGGVRVPMIVAGPGVAQGAECHEPVITPDFYPTFLELTGVAGDPVQNRRMDGVSLAPLFADPGAQLDRDDIFWHYPHYHPGGATPHGAIRRRDWKLIEFYEDNHSELYNLRVDIGEKNDLAPDRPELVEDLRKRLNAWRHSVGAQMPTPNSDHDPEKDGWGRR